MKISELWLREWVNFRGDTAALVHQLTMQGLEVESIEPAGPPLEHVVVGRVVAVAPHPNADRLRVCQVDGGAMTVQVVCGAANVRAGGVYPLALPGAAMPGGLSISRTSLRGVDSAGMLCSAAELGIGDAGAAARAEGLLELDASLAAGTPLCAALQLDDRILDLKITPNRADCFSVLGVARDLAATTGLPFAEPGTIPVPAEGGHVTSSLVDEPGLCPTFAVRAVRGLRPDTRSPLWVRERLRRSGLRSIHPVVDVTNLVMLELGQPLHAYDLDRLGGGLRVRRARAGEALPLLTGSTVEMADDVLVIADDSGAVGIAGIMGGSSTAVSATTTNVLLESAFFSPGAITGRARRLGLQTDASTRFERGVDPTGQQRALERATQLLQMIAGGTAGPVQVAGPGVPARSPVVLRRDRLARVLGATVPDQDVEAILRSLGMKVEPAVDGWQARPPAFRFDVAIEVDLVEEVARVFGYERIAPEPGHQATRLGESPGNRIELGLVRAAIAQRGYREVVTYSFVDSAEDRLLAGGSEGVALVNPLSADLSVMRQGLWPGLVQALRHNLARQQRRVCLFEAGVRFVPGGGHLLEESVIAGIRVGAALPEQWGEPARPADFFDMKADVEALLALVAPADQFQWVADQHPALHPGQSARVVRQGQPVGWVGVLHPGLTGQLELDQAPVLFELSAGLFNTRSTPDYLPVSRFPAVRRDLSVLVSRDTPVGRMVEAARVAAGPALQDVLVFDIFAGEHIDAGQKSVALGLILQETSRTLTDADADKIVGGVVQRLASEFGARVRQ
ncbi:MAG: phenylalanine--tRNA ligase subunit beta [Gammaproteobacteria bacterium]